jgi:hypothetical protein
MTGGRGEHRRGHPHFQNATLCINPILLTRIPHAAPVD